MSQQHIKSVNILYSTLLPETLEIWGKPKNIFIKKILKNQALNVKTNKERLCARNLGIMRCQYNLWLRIPIS